MKYFAITLCGILLLNLPAMAQEEQSPTRQDLKAMAAFIGDWHAETKATKDSKDGTVKKGDKIDLFMSFKWVARKNAIINHMRVKAGDQLIFAKMRLIGWDNAAECIVGTEFDSYGRSQIRRYQRKGDTWQSTQKVTNKFGKVRTGTWVYSGISENSFFAEATNRKQDGEPLPDGPKLAWKRVK